MAFRLFRLIIGLVLAGFIGYWLVQSEGGIEQISAALGQDASAGEMVSIALKVVGCLLLFGAYYFALWSDSAIHRNLDNIFSIPELLRKLIFTIALLCIYRIGVNLPLPGLDQDMIQADVARQSEGAFGQALQHLSMFTGGSLQRFALFGLGIMPYISASIIFQLLTSIVPALERLQKEGPAGYKKIQEYTRYATVALCIVQAFFLMKQMGVSKYIYPEYQDNFVRIYLMGVCGLTAGTMFLMWLGEQIDEYGIGNGISLLIMAGILSRLPGAIYSLSGMVDFSLTGAGAEGSIGPLKILFLVMAFVFVVAGAILITQGQRRIPIQQAKHMRGRRVYGGQRQYLPLRVNHGGVMPIIFASSLMILPGIIFGWASQKWSNDVTRTLNESFRYGSYVWSVVFVAMIFFFAYFWTTIQFRPKDMADQLRDYGSFIPGLRPGRRTAEYLERVMERITFCGAAFLAVIAVIPTVVTNAIGIPYGIATYLGGTGLLIVVSVALDLVQRIEANLVMRNYGGFLGGSTRIKGAYR